MLTISTIAAGYSLAAIVIITAGIAALTRRSASPSISWPTAEQADAIRRRIGQ